MASLAACELWSRRSILCNPRIAESTSRAEIEANGIAGGRSSPSEAEKAWW